MAIIAQYVFDFLIAVYGNVFIIDLSNPIAGGFHQGQESLPAFPQQFFNFL